MRPRDDCIINNNNATTGISPFKSHFSFLLLLQYSSVKIFSINKNTVIYLYICLSKNLLSSIYYPDLRQLDEVQLPAGTRIT
jgi:hypothetical protein